MNKPRPPTSDEISSKTAVRIPFEHLHPVLKELIGPKLKLHGSDYPGRRDSIRRARTLRTVVDVQGILFLKAILDGHPTPDLLAVTGLTGVARTGIAKIIQQKHRVLKDAIKEHGIFDPEFEGNYSPEWQYMPFVTLTYPVVRVERNGDLTFKKLTSRELLQYHSQKSPVGVLGLNPWRWRIYLRHPNGELDD